jgi:hypothetical protein
MKKFLLVFFLVYVYSLSLSGQSSGNAGSPEMSIPVFKLDIGETLFNPDSTYLYKFPYYNVGTAPLSIIQTISGCPCISVTFPDTPLLPGQVDTIYVHYKPTRVGKFTQRVAVISNASEHSLMQLYAKATFLKPSADK